jgi:RNA recognition motif-containing protein
VTNAQVIADQDTGRSRGFGFVELPTPETAKTAIDSLNGQNVDGRDLTVGIAKDRSH